MTAWPIQITELLGSCYHNEDLEYIIWVLYSDNLIKSRNKITQSTLSGPSLKAVLVIASSMCRKTPVFPGPGL